VTEPTWTNWHEALRVVVYRPYLKRTLLVALIVGSVLFVINHLDEVLRGQASLNVWIKVVVTFFVPFVVSNIGILVATHQRPGSHRE
jgi:membrane protein required for beta-lactamase induction